MTESCSNCNIILPPGSPEADLDCPLGREANDRFQAQTFLLKLAANVEMRAVIQRVSEASVTIGKVVKGAIRQGLVVLVAIEETDTAEDIEWLAGKVVRMRIFNDDNGVMNRSVQEVGGEILLISQFTLLASTKKGNRPSYSRSARSEVAVPIYNNFIHRLVEELGRPIQTGEFGADMKVNLTNDGPVTIIIDSRNRE